MTKYVCVGTGHDLRVQPVKDGDEKYPVETLSDTPVAALQRVMDVIAEKEAMLSQEVARLRTLDAQTKLYLKRTLGARATFRREREIVGRRLRSMQLEETVADLLSRYDIEPQLTSEPDKLFGYRTEPDGTKVRVMKSGKVYAK